jgi:hypothetical protein
MQLLPSQAPLETIGLQARRSQAPWAPPLDSNDSSDTRRTAYQRLGQIPSEIEGGTRVTITLVRCLADLCREIVRITSCRLTLNPVLNQALFSAEARSVPRRLKSRLRMRTEDPNDWQEL